MDSAQREAPSVSLSLSLSLCLHVVFTHKVETAWSYTTTKCSVVWGTVMRSWPTSERSNIKVVGLEIGWANLAVSVCMYYASRFPPRFTLQSSATTLQLSWLHVQEANGNKPRETARHWQCSHHRRVLWLRGKYRTPILKESSSNCEWQHESFGMIISRGC